MKLSKLEAVFVIVVFCLVYAVLVSDVTITGSVIADNQEPMPVVESKTDGVLVHLALMSHAEEISAQSGDIIELESYGQKALIRVKSMYEDYAKGTRYVAIAVDPGNKQTLLFSGQQALFDLDNDGRDDVKVTLDRTDYGEAVLLIDSI